MKMLIGKEITLDVDLDKLASFPAVVSAALEFAVKQALTNAHAEFSIKSNPTDYQEKSRAAAEKRLETMMSGVWASKSGGSRMDQVTREMNNLAETDIESLVAKLGKKRKDYAKELWASLIKKQLASKEAAYRAKAEKIVAERRESVADAEVPDDMLALLLGVDEPASEAETEE